MREIKIFSIVGKAFVPEKIAPSITKQFFRAGYQNVPYNQYAICHIVFNSSWISPGDNPDIYLAHET